MKDAAIIELQSSGFFDGGWKTSTANNYEKYKQAINQFSPRIKFLENWSETLTYNEGQLYIEALIRNQGSASSLGEQNFTDLLRDYDFTERTQGGVIAILEVLAEDPTQFRGLHYQSLRPRLEARLLDARNRLAKARGAEELADPDAKVSVADLQLGVFGSVDYWSDYFFEIPSIVTNFFGQNLGEHASQDKYVDELLNLRGQLDVILSSLAFPEVRFDPQRLAEKYPDTYEDYLVLEKHYIDFSDAALKISKQNWQRTRIYNVVNAHLNAHGNFIERMTIEGKLKVIAAQQIEEDELIDRNLRLAYLKLEFFSHTGNYRAAAQQLTAYQNLANQQLKMRGFKTRIDFSELALELKTKAAAAETISVYQSLLNEAIASMITGALTSRIQQGILYQLKGEEWLEQYLRRQPPAVPSIPHKFLQTMFPPYQHYAGAGIWGMVEGTGWTLVKEKIAFEVAQQANEFNEGSPVWDQSDFQSVVDNIFDIGKDVAEATYPTAREVLVEKSVGYYANQKKVDLLLEEAQSARETLDMRMNHALRRMKEAVEGADWANLSLEQRLLRLNAVESEFRGPLSDVGVQEALFKYRKIHSEFEDAVQDQETRSQKIKNYMAWLPYADQIKKIANDKIDSMQRRGARVTNPALVVSRIDSWKRVLFNKHTVEDLEILVNAGSSVTEGNPVLTPGMDIDTVRSALNASLKDARERGDSALAERIDNIAGGIDDIRIARINEILKEFLETTEYGREVALVVQGGAAKGNPEYQGIFADIDFTLMLREDSTADQKALKKAMLDFFAERNYVLAAEGKASSMDSEGFVQKLGVFDASQASERQIIEDVMEKGKDPTRFYTEGGTLWFINNAAYSGKTLWQGAGNGVEWVNVPQDFGYDLAVDMTRYIGFIASPKYTEAYLRDKPPGYQRETLEKALSKTKYFIRLIDAYEIGHTQGNAIYNKRIENQAESGENASYHWQIFKDAEEMVRQQDPNDPSNVITAADLPMIERIAKMKMKGEFTSPFDVIEGEGYTGDAAIAEAHKTMEWMRETAPKVIAKLAGDFHEDIEARVKNEDKEVRNLAMSSISRMSIVARNIMTLDSPEAIPLLVSKVQGDQKLTVEQHAQLIRNNIEQANAGKHVAQELAGLLESPFVSKEEDAALNTKIDASINGEREALKDIPASEIALFQYEKLFKPFFDQLVYIANQME